MNRTLGKTAAVINVLAVAAFALAMIGGSMMGSYLSSIFIAVSFVVLMCAFYDYSPPGAKTAGLCAVAFGAMYGLCNMAVYYIQITTVQGGQLTQDAARLLDFGQYGLMFNLDMLGYCLMSVATFFAGFTIVKGTKASRWLKGLLHVHGIFAVSCFIVPMLGLFSNLAADSAWIGSAVLLVWCAYFLPVGCLTYIYLEQIPQS